jgi:hypothetical protein
MMHNAASVRRAGAFLAPSARAAGALSLALALGACMLHDDRPVALAAPEPAPKAARAAAAPDVKTVRRSEAALAEDDAAPTASATPAPQQIFDFHPAGSRADAWRQPFIIDPNDGPLAADVRRSAAELKAFLALPKVDPKTDLRTAARHRCGETDIATAKPGCAATPAETPTPR